MKRDEETHAYIGRMRDCGCFVAATVDSGDKRTADNVAEFIEDGLIIERVPMQFVRDNRWGCVHKPTQESLPL